MTLLVNISFSSIFKARTLMIFFFFRHPLRLLVAGSRRNSLPWCIQCSVEPMHFLGLAPGSPEGLLALLDVSRVMERKSGQDLSKILGSYWSKS